MLPTNMVILGNQMATSKVSKAQSKATAMVSEINKAYAKQGKTLSGQQVKPSALNDAQQMAAP
jgi:hypothetical protein